MGRVVGVLALAGLLSGCDSLTLEYRLKRSFVEMCSATRPAGDCKKQLRKYHDLCFSIGYRHTPVEGLPPDPQQNYLDCIEQGFERWNSHARALRERELVGRR